MNCLEVFSFIEILFLVKVRLCFLCLNISEFAEERFSIEYMHLFTDHSFNNVLVQIKNSLVDKKVECVEVCIFGEIFKYSLIRVRVCF